jgi:predicted DNA-binding antitoxin AbrB/MazE fold protein
MTEAWLLFDEIALRRITAIYENGVLRPLKPLPLQEHQTVQIQVLPEDSGDELEQIADRTPKYSSNSKPFGSNDILSLPSVNKPSDTITFGATSVTKALSL